MGAWITRGRASLRDGSLGTVNRYGVFCGRVAPDWPGKRERSQGTLEKRKATTTTMRRSFKERNLLRESSIVASGDRHKRPHKNVTQMPRNQSMIRHHVYRLFYLKFGRASHCSDTKYVFLVIVIVLSENKSKDFI